MKLGLKGDPPDKVLAVQMHRYVSSCPQQSGWRSTIPLFSSEQTERSQDFLSSQSKWWGLGKARESASKHRVEGDMGKQPMLDFWLRYTSIGQLAFTNVDMYRPMHTYPQTEISTWLTDYDLETNDKRCSLFRSHRDGGSLVLSLNNGFSFTILKSYALLCKKIFFI